MKELYKKINIEALMKALTFAYNQKLFNNISFEKIKIEDMLETCNKLENYKTIIPILSRALDIKWLSLEIDIKKYFKISRRW